MTERPEQDVLETDLKPLSQGERLFHEIRTVEQARSYVMELVDKVINAREQCDVIIPGDPEMTARLQRKAYRSWMIRYGQALGALTTLMHCRVLNDVAYSELHQRVLQTGVPTIVGEV